NVDANRKGSRAIAAQNAKTRKAGRWPRQMALTLPPSSHDLRQIGDRAPHASASPGLCFVGNPSSDQTANPSADRPSLGLSERNDPGLPIVLRGKGIHKAGPNRRWAMLGKY